MMLARKPAAAAITFSCGGTVHSQRKRTMARCLVHLHRRSTTSPPSSPSASRLADVATITFAGAYTGKTGNGGDLRTSSPPSQLRACHDDRRQMPGGGVVGFGSGGLTTAPQQKTMPMSSSSSCLGELGWAGSDSDSDSDSRCQHGAQEKDAYSDVDVNANANRDDRAPRDGPLREYNRRVREGLVRYDTHQRGRENSVSSKKYRHSLMK